MSRQQRTLLWIGGKTQSPSRLEPSTCAREPSPSEIGAVYEEGHWLSGQEPLMRPDFLRVLEACRAPVSVRTQGLALSDPNLVRTLMQKGVERVCIPIFSIRPDAHDWLVARSGAVRRALKAIRVCAEAGLQVHVECTPTRPCMGLLKETIGVLGRLGVHTVWIRRPRLEWMNADDQIALSPRLGLLEPELREAQNAAERLGLRVHWVGFSICSVSGIRGPRWASDAWVDVSGVPLVPLHEPVSCQCATPCEGLPGDYIQRFGWQEFQLGPSTRIRSVSRRVMSPKGRFSRGPKQTRLRIEFGGPHTDLHERFNDHVVVEASREIRRRMVEAAQTGTSMVEVCNSGMLLHPDAEDLLWELTRLSFERVRIAGDLSLLAKGSERLFRRFKGIHEVYAVLYAPDATTHDQFCGQAGAQTASLEALDKFMRFSGAQTGVYAMLQHASQLEPYLEVFHRNGWVPHFRCCATEEALVEIEKALHHIDDERVQKQLGAQLPKPFGMAPRAEVITPLDSWGAGIPRRFSRIDPLLGVNVGKRLAG